MRNFFCYLIRGVSLLYFCVVLAFSLRLVYNEYYTEIYEEVEVSWEDGKKVYPLGQILGFYIECQGVFVIDTSEIETVSGTFSSPAKGVLQSGDYIIEVNGTVLEEKETLVKAVSNSKGEALELKVVRGENEFNTSITPVLGKNASYMLGVWVKDDLAGVGTITYFEEDGDFAALGHGMGDGVTKDLLLVEEGEVYFTDVIGIQKGEKGEPGEVKGVIYYGSLNHRGELDTNCKEGIYGTLDEEDTNAYMDEVNPCTIGSKHEIEIGKAQIISDVSGERRYYDIEITYVDYLATNSNKGLHIQVVDDELIELTGGIVQGMSGSPIIQNGKLIGAVTHVLINEPTRGYGIFIECMIEASN